MKAKRYEANLPVKKIRQSPFHFRKESSKEKLEDLAESVRKHGLIHAISVVEDPAGGYALINGHRRWLAHKELLKAAKIRANVYEFEPDELKDEAQRRQAVAEFLLAANKSEPLIPVERARYYFDAMERFGWSVEDIAKVHDVTVKSVQDDLVFLSLDDRVLGMVQSNPDRFTTDHLRVLADYSSAAARKSWRLEPEEQVKAAEHLVKQEDKAIVESPLEWEKHVKGIVKKRRADKAAERRKVGRGKEDPVKALFKLLEGIGKGVDQLKSADLSSIKEIRPEDKGQAASDLYAMAQGLIDIAEGPVQKLKTSRANGGRQAAGGRKAKSRA
jgi:ParB/RepB/Spo0J family partition protein